jgi:hypothetical protein
MTSIRTLTGPLLALALPFLAGCSSGPAYQILTPFMADDFRTWSQAGKETITGQAFFKLPGGQVVTCAGESVSLLPATGYNTELEKLLETGKGYPPNYDRQAHRFDRKAMCDGAGKFSFDGVPHLNWLVVVRITWQEPSSIPYIGPYDKGGYLFQELQVDDTHTKVTLSNQDFVADTD